MKLITLQDLRLPVTVRQFEPLMENVVKLNLIDASLTEPQQRALGIYLHTIDLWIKSGGKIDYRTRAGRERLKDDAETFCGTGNPVATRHGDLAAAHLAIDYHDTCMRLKEHGLPPISDNTNSLLNDCVDLTVLTKIQETRLGLLLDFAGKRKAI